MNLLLTQGNALRIPLADESVHYTYLVATITEIDDLPMFALLRRGNDEETIG